METRLGPRVKIDIKIISKFDTDLKQQVSLVGGNCFEGHGCNISTIGIGTFTKHFLPKGLILQMEIEGTPFGLTKPMKIKGEIRHCEYITKAKYKCGIKFLNLPKEYREAIKNLISAYEKRKKTRLNLS